MSWSDRFAGRTAIVTGGASGLGKAVASRLAAEGGRVVLWDVDAAALEAAKNELATTHVRVVDVSDQAAVVGATADAADALGGHIDILINSAGITGATA